jgi:hypothetical protein
MYVNVNHHLQPYATAAIVGTAGCDWLGEKLGDWPFRAAAHLLMLPTSVALVLQIDVSRTPPGVARRTSRRSALISEQPP